MNKQDTFDPGPLGRQVFHEAKCWTAYEWLGAHAEGEGVRFTLWAPHAQRVSLVCDANDWQVGATPMTQLMEDHTLWTVFLAEGYDGMYYKYAIQGQDGEMVLKADPYGRESAIRPDNASRVSLEGLYEWRDQAWMDDRDAEIHRKKPMNIYEVHLGSWQYNEEGKPYSYREQVNHLIPYLLDMGYTHVECMPILEHPFDGSWGYQVTGYFAGTSRYGRPNDLRYLIDELHRSGIGVILDWVPAHFCKDEHGLGRFDGQPLYEYENPLRGENPKWGTYQFDLSRPEVVSFLLSSAYFWLKEFHFDGLRVDAVTSMLFLDYEREEDQWEPNEYGGNENIESIDFLRHLNKILHQELPDIFMIAEEATAWPKVTQPDYEGGLGFDYKWNMGWLHDIQEYAKEEAYERKNKHNEITFSLTYAFTENYILPFSHDEVVHGKKSFVNKMPGDYWQQFANLRAFLGYMMGHPGKKLLFMGTEFGQFIEWDEKRQLDWFLLDYDKHREMKTYVHDLNHFYKCHEALWQRDCSDDGFQWMDCNDREKSILSLARFSDEGHVMICLYNFRPESYHGYKVPVPVYGQYAEMMNSDKDIYGGSNQYNGMPLEAVYEPWLGQNQYIEVTIPPLGAVFFACTEEWDTPQQEEGDTSQASQKEEPKEKYQE